MADAQIDWRKEAASLAASLTEVARGGDYIQAQAALARYEEAVRVADARPKTTVHFSGGPWARQTYEVKHVVGPLFAVGHEIGNHYWLDTKSDPPTYVWDGTEWEFFDTAAPASGSEPTVTERTD